MAVQAVHHLGPADHPGQREAVAEALGEGQQVGRHAVRLVPQKCSPVRPQPVCTSSEINRMPYSSRTSLQRGEQPVGRRGEAADALDRLGDQRGDVAGGRGGEHLAQVVDRSARCSRRRTGPAEPRQPVAGVQVADVERVTARRPTSRGCR